MYRLRKVGVVMLCYRVEDSVGKAIADIPHFVDTILTVSRLLILSGALLLLGACSTQDPGGPPRKSGDIYSRIQGCQIPQISGSSIVGTSMRLDQPGEANASIASAAVPRGVFVDLESSGRAGAYPKVTFYARCQYDDKWTQLVRTTIAGRYRAHFPFMGSHQTGYNIRIVYDAVEPKSSGFPPLFIHEVRLDD